MTEINVIRRESYIKARTIKIKTAQLRHIEETVKLANNGISSKISSHSRTPEGYQMFLHADTDGGIICRQILDALLRLPEGAIVIERINC